MHKFFLSLGEFLGVEILRQSGLKQRTFNMFMILVIAFSPAALVDNRISTTPKLSVQENLMIGVSAPENTISNELVAEEALHSFLSATGGNPTTIWSVPVGGTEININDVATDLNGNTYVAGNPRFVAKLDSTGVVQWTYTFNTVNNLFLLGIALDQNADVYVVGHIIGSAPTYVSRIFYAKLSNAGYGQWQETYTIPSTQGADIAVDGQGNIYITGLVATSDGYGDTLITKISPASHQMIWNVSLGGAYYEYGFGITVDTTGNIFATGMDVVSANSRAAFATRLDTNGNVIWYKTFGSSTEDDTGYGVTFDGFGNVYVAGDSEGSWGNPIRDFQGPADVFVAKLDESNGNVEWNTFLGGTEWDDHSGIAWDEDHIIVAGGSDSVWGYPISDAGTSFIAELDSNGALKWNTFLGDIGAVAIAVHAGSMYVAGGNMVSRIDDKEKVPLILIPGVTGTELYNPAGQVWPNVLELASSSSDDHLKVLRLAPNGIDPFIDPAVDPNYDIDYGGLIRGGDIVWINGKEKNLDIIYGKTITALKAAGYVEGVNLFLFPYDWRLDNETTADRLLSEIDTWRTQTGAAQVDILAHSMGGIITRIALTRPQSIGKVRRVVTLGTPILGATKLLGVLEYQTPCFFELAGICFTDAGMTQEIVTNSPAAHQILPGPAFDIAQNPPLVIARDTNNDGHAEGDQPYAKWSALLRNDPERNVQLINLGFSYHQVYDDLQLADSQVEFYRVIGDSLATPDQIWEYNYCSNSNGELTCRVAYEVMNGSGDGTVPLHSADVYNPDNNFDYRNGIPNYYYPKVDHMGLVQDPEVLAAVINLFGRETGTPASSAQTTFNSKSLQDSPYMTADTTNVLFDSLNTSPQTLSGIELESLGSLNAYIEDNSGNVLGKPYNQADAVIEESIPGGSYYSIGDTQSLFLANSGTYIGYLKVTDSNGARLRVRTYANDQINGQAVFHVNPPAGAELQLALSSAQALADLRLQIDQNADGVIDQEVSPDSVVAGSGAADREAPTTTISVDLIPDGQCGATLTAVDNAGGAGVADTYYQLDGSSPRVEVYTSPFSFACGTLVKYMSVDHAGNTETTRVFQTGQPSTPTNTPTDTPTVTPTNTATETSTYTPTSTPTDIPTSTPTDTPTSTPTDTPTPTSTPTSTPTNTPTGMPTFTPTPVSYTLVLQPNFSNSMDTYIYSSSVNANYGTSSEIGVGEDNSSGNNKFARTLIKFDLSSIPLNATIKSVTLSLWTSKDLASNTRMIRVYRLKRPFSATQATWNIAATGVNWQTPGASGTNDRESVDIGSVQVLANESLNTQKQITLTIAKIQEIVGGAFTNNGFIIVADVENNDRFNYYTSDSTNAYQRPKLVIVYTLPYGPICATPTPRIPPPPDSAGSLSLPPCDDPTVTIEPPPPGN